MASAVPLKRGKMMGSLKEIVLKEMGAHIEHIKPIFLS
jgi:hypothetical protein